MLTEIYYDIEFSKEPAAAAIKQIIAEATKTDDRGIKWSVEDMPDEYMLDSSVATLKISLNPHPARESYGIEGGFDDIDDNSVPDHETPAELIEKICLKDNTISVAYTKLAQAIALKNGQTKEILGYAG